MNKYNGHQSWNAWNVALWFSNDYSIYSYCMELIDKVGLDDAITIIWHEIWVDKKGLCSKIFPNGRTKDGAKVNKSCIRLALRDIAEEN